MSEFSSCYFCGTALDAPVERYPLAPPNVDVDTGRTVALCPTCRRKLGKILEVVAGELDAAATGGDANATAGEATEAPSDDAAQSADEGLLDVSTPEPDLIDPGVDDPGMDASAADDAPGQPTGGDAPGEAADDAAATDVPSVLATPAAKQVIKLLQNREFPLDREEFEVVASNAYDIPMRDCQEVVDALVTGGYVDEADGQLVRP